MYFRFNLSFRDVEELMAERGVDVSYETIRQWVDKFGGAYAKRLGLGARHHHPFGTWMKFTLRLMARWFTSGALLMMKERFWMSLFKGVEIPKPPYVCFVNY